MQTPSCKFLSISRVRGPIGRSTCTPQLSESLPQLPPADRCCATPTRAGGGASHHTFLSTEHWALKIFVNFIGGKVYLTFFYFHALSGVSSLLSFSLNFLCCTSLPVVTFIHSINPTSDPPPPGSLPAPAEGLTRDPTVVCAPPDSVQETFCRLPVHCATLHAYTALRICLKRSYVST